MSGSVIFPEMDRDRDTKIVLCRNLNLKFEEEAAVCVIPVSPLSLVEVLKSTEQCEPSHFRYCHLRWACGLGWAGHQLGVSKLSQGLSSFGAFLLGVLSLFLPFPSIDSLFPPISLPLCSSSLLSVKPRAPSLCIWPAFPSGSLGVLAERKPDGPAVPTVISQQTLASLLPSLLSWPDGSICLYLGRLCSLLYLFPRLQHKRRAMHSVLAKVGGGEWSVQWFY